MPSRVTVVRPPILRVAISPLLMRYLMDRTDTPPKATPASGIEKRNCSMVPCNVVSSALVRYVYRRSKPHRMSVASAASQMRILCAVSSARRLGRPIMMRPATQQATTCPQEQRSPALRVAIADALHRIPAQPSNCAHAAIALRSSGQA